MSHPNAPSPVILGFRLIGIYKLATAVLALILAIGLLRLFQADRQAILVSWARSLRLDPENRWIHSVLSRITRADAEQLYALEAGTIFYALLHIVEGVGILRGRRWGGYLIILATSALIPLECYEIIHKQSLLRAVVLLANLGIVIYLIIHRHGLFRRTSDHR